MGVLDGRVVIVTGAGRGMGRAHALALAGAGARVVVNDLGGDLGGQGDDVTYAQAVVDEIVAAGGEAVVNGANVADWEGAESLIRSAIDTFGGLDVLVNNAGILRDKVLVNLTEADWDAVINVHLKGTFAPTHFAAGYWRDQAKAGNEVRASVVNTTSPTGLHGNVGQANYGAAKAGIVGFTLTAAMELRRYGVRVNAISPGARTRMTEDLPGIAEVFAAPDDPNAFDKWSPANIAPFVVFLAAPDCTISGQVFGVQGGEVSQYQGWTLQERVSFDHQPTFEELELKFSDVPALGAGTGFF